MTDELKPVRCGCGGEAHHDSVSCWNPEEEEWIPNFWHRVICKNCGTQTKSFYTKSEAITAWNKAMGERTAKVVGVEKPIIGDEEGKTIRVTSCSACENTVSIFDNFCPNCGCRLDWNEDIPMEYFESGGI